MKLWPLSSFYQVMLVLNISGSIRINFLPTEFFTKYGVPRIETPAYTEYNALFTQFWGSLLAGEENVAGLATEYAELMDEAAAKYEGWTEK